MTPCQCRTARILLGWTQADLARTARVSVYEIDAFEREARGLVPADYTALYATLYGAGVVFTDDGHSRLIENVNSTSHITS